jgi:hypothetical protein
MLDGSAVLIVAALIGLQGISVIVSIALRRRFGWPVFVSEATAVSSGF